MYKGRTYKGRAYKGRTYREGMYKYKYKNVHEEDVCTLLKRNRPRGNCSCRVVQGEGATGRGRCRGFNGAGGMGQDLLLVMDRYGRKVREAGLQLLDEGKERRKLASFGIYSSNGSRLVESRP